MKKLLLLLALLLLPLRVSAETRVMVVSDIHYLAPSLWEGSELFLRALSRGDGKAAQYATALVQALAEEALDVRPDLLLITGDLTFNGETDSHIALAELLRPVTEAGIPVAVIPGNHDINNISAVLWLPNGFRTVPAPDSAGFREIWKDMLAQELPGPGFSGVVRLADCWVAVGDYSIYEYEQAANGLADDSRLAWMRSVLEEAAAAGMPVISASHQSMLTHTDFRDETYRVAGGDRVADMLREAGSVLNLSGHLHLQHITSEEGFTDIATGAFSMYPHRWGLVTVSEGRISYEARALADTRLPADLTDATRAWFRNAIGNKLRPILEELSLTEAEITAMLNYAGDVNLACFGGTLSLAPELLTSPARALWREKAPDTAYARSLELTLSREPADCLHWRQE